MKLANTGKVKTRLALVRTEFEYVRHLARVVHLYHAYEMQPDAAVRRIANMVVAWMNAAQELSWSDFPESVIRAGVERLWQPSAYIGAYGQLESAKIAAYVRKWEDESEE